MDDVTFPFPFPPYDVQESFMKQLYSVIKNEEIGIFESPTGTGKSLSIICGTMKWLKDHKSQRKLQLQSLVPEKKDDSADDWFDSFAQKQEEHFKSQDAKEELKSITEYENRIRKLRTETKFNSKSSRMPSMKRMKKSDDDDGNVEPGDEDEFLIADKDDSSDDDEEKKVEKKKHVLKIYYASRTHSQLAQFLGEIQRSPFSDDVTVTTLGSRAVYCVNESVSTLKNIGLINEKCTEMQRKSNKKSCSFLKNLPDLEDAILASVQDIEDLVHHGRELKACPYYATRRAIPDAELVLLPYNVLLHKPTREAYGISVKDNVLIIDEAHNLVEALNGMYSAEVNGLTLQQCFWQVEAYLNAYRTRFSQENLRFIKSLFNVLRLLLDSLKSISCDSSQSRIVSVNEFLDLAGIAHVNIFELVKFAESSLISQKLHGFAASKVSKGITPAEDQSKTKEDPLPRKSGTSSFLCQIKLKKNVGPKATVNKASKSSTSKSKQNRGPKTPEVTANQTKCKPSESKQCGVPEVTTDQTRYKPSAIFTCLEFLKTLTSLTTDGRILINKSSTADQTAIKFMHLNPATHFEDIVKDARSIVLAGGTMQPVTEFTEQLFLPSGVSPDRISLFSCGHVIPPENLLAIGLESGPCGNMLDFTFKSRQLPATVKELGSVLLNVSNTVTGGVVCFFPSYDYEDFIYKELVKLKMIQAIERKFKVFREPKFSSDVDKVLGDYSKCIFSSGSQNSSSVSSSSPTASVSSSSQKLSSVSGALLFCIVGGKMSEGINFSDDLGRCVIMVGLPYPNKFSVELKEKMAFLNQRKTDTNGKNPGDVYYSNLCMKAVNQSIGRAIRHKNDYASILLLDYRYKNNSVKELLPGWIRKSLSFHQKFGTAYVALKKFYTSKTKS